MPKIDCSRDAVYTRTHFLLALLDRTYYDEQPRPISHWFWPLVLVVLEVELLRLLDLGAAGP